VITNSQNINVLDPAQAFKWVSYHLPVYFCRIAETSYWVHHDKNHKTHLLWSHNRKSDFAALLQLANYHISKLKKGYRTQPLRPTQMVWDCAALRQSDHSWNRKLILLVLLSWGLVVLGRSSSLVLWIFLPFLVEERHAWCTLLDAHRAENLQQRKNKLTSVQKLHFRICPGISGTSGSREVLKSIPMTFLRHINPPKVPTSPPTCGHRCAPYGVRSSQDLATGCKANTNLLFSPIRPARPNRIRCVLSPEICENLIMVMRENLQGHHHYIRDHLHQQHSPERGRHLHHQRRPAGLEQPVRVLLCHPVGGWSRGSDCWSASLLILSSHPHCTFSHYQQVCIL
jgi:hypothetical protein